MTNHSLDVFLILDAGDVHAVMTAYERDVQGRSGMDLAKRTMHKTFDPNIKVGDYVLVPTETRHNMTVVQVKAVDVEPDFDSPDKVDWIIGVVDTSDHEETLRREAEAIAMVKSAEKTRMRRELKDALTADTDEGELRSVYDGPALPPPEPPREPASLTSQSTDFGDKPHF